MFLLRRLALLALVCFSSMIVSDAEDDVGLTPVLSARAYLCNSHNQDVTPTHSADDTPLQMGAMLRVCIEVIHDDNIVATTYDDEELFILKVIDFYFLRDLTPSSLVDVPGQLDSNVMISPNREGGNNVTRVRQQVLENGVVTNSGTTSLICEPGSRLCIFQLMSLTDVFFVTAGSVQGMGSVALQYGGGRERDRRQRSLRGGLADNSDGIRGAAPKRDLQDFAGVAPLSLEFSVAVGTLKSSSAGSETLPSDEVGSEVDDRSSVSVREYWMDSEPYVKGLIIGMFIIILSTLLCLCVCLLFWRGSCTDYFVYDRKRRLPTVEDDSRQQVSRNHVDGRHKSECCYYSEDVSASSGQGLPVLLQWPSDEHTTQKQGAGQNQNRRSHLRRDVDDQAQQTRKSGAAQNMKRRSYLDDVNDEDLSETHSIDDDEEWENDGNLQDERGYQERTVDAVRPPPPKHLPSSSAGVGSIRPSPVRTKSGMSSTGNRVAADGTIVASFSSVATKKSSNKNKKKKGGGKKGESKLSKKASSKKESKATKKGTRKGPTT